MKNLQKAFRGPLAWILIALMLILIAVNLATRATGEAQIPTSQAVAMINGKDKLKEVTLTDGAQTIQITAADDKKYKSVWVGNQDDALVQRLNQRVAEKTLDTWVAKNPQPSFWSSLLYNFLPFLLLIVGFFVVMNLVQGAVVAVA